MSSHADCRPSWDRVSGDTRLIKLIPLYESPWYYFRRTAHLISHYYSKLEVTETYMLHAHWCIAKEQS